MTTAFDLALAHTLGIEGDFTNIPADSGGATRFGITERVARAFGYMDSMELLPLSLAKRIYRENYWDLLHLDMVVLQSVPVALELFDTCVNTKQGFAARSLQRLLNVFNREQKDYSDIEVDGLIGAGTIQALRAFMNHRGELGEKVLVEALNSLQGAFYTELAEARSKDEAFTFGWFANRVLKRAA